MESFGAIPLSGTMLPEQDILMESLSNSIASLNSDASFGGALTTTRSMTSRGAGTPSFIESSELKSSGFQFNEAPNMAKPVGSSASENFSGIALNSVNVFNQPTMVKPAAISGSGQEARAASDSFTGVAMSAPLASTSTAQDIMINFQPDTAAIPAGYIKDIGEAYSEARGFGWVRQDSLSQATHIPIDITPNARDRNRIGIGQLQDTIIHMQFPASINNYTAVKTSAAWEYALPNGAYDVTVGVGDKPKYDSLQSINVEGINAINRFQSSSEQEFKQATVEVDVTDGKLTIDAIGGMNTKINYLHIKADSQQVVNLIETISSDMDLNHEGKPQGVPNSLDWANHPRIGMGNDPGNFRALTAWGQLYEDSAGNPAQNTRVQIRDIMTYVLSKSDGQWHQLQNSQLVEGAAFREDYAGNTNISPDVRKEPDGTLSVKAGGGYNYHFWPSGRASINPNDIGGVITTVQARLITEDPSKPDDRSTARYLLSMGGDYWSTLDAQWDNYKTNGDIGIGRFKYVEKDWQSFNMSTLSVGALRQNPPPIEPVN